VDIIIYIAIFIAGLTLGIAVRWHATDSVAIRAEQVMRKSRDYWRDEYQVSKDSLTRIKADIGEASRRVRSALDEYEVELLDNEVYPQPKGGSWDDIE